MTPKENPKDKAARLRERRISDLEQKDTAQNTAAGLTSDLRAVYGLKKLPNMFNMTAAPPSKRGGLV